MQNVSMRRGVGNGKRDGNMQRLTGGLLAPPGPDPAEDHPFFLLVLVSTVGLSVAALLVFLLSPLNVTRALVALGIAHGYSDSAEVGSMDLAAYVVGYAASAALLLALGVLVGREVPRDS